MKRSSAFSFLVAFLLVAGCSHKMDNK
ncbi:OmpA family protein, partial [Helicobacter pylori]